MVLDEEELSAVVEEVLENEELDDEQIKVSGIIKIFY